MSEGERPGRYQRSFSGLVAAMLITVVAVVGFVGFRALVSDKPEAEPTEVDYLEIVGLAQESDLLPVYPEELPKGWLATRAEVLPDDPAGFDLALLTDDEEFVGVVWSEESLDTLLKDRVDDEDVEDAESLSVTGSVADDWEGYSDPGGDHAYAADVEDHTVLVYGSAPEDDLQAIVESLTTDRLPE